MLKDYHIYPISFSIKSRKTYADSSKLYTMYLCLDFQNVSLLICTCYFFSFIYFVAKIIPASGSYYFNCLIFLNLSIFLLLYELVIKFKIRWYLPGEISLNYSLKLTYSVISTIFLFFFCYLVNKIISFFLLKKATPRQSICEPP